MIDDRSTVTELAVRTASPLAVLIGVYLLFAGHNNPGGGFAAGLVFGAVVALRTLAGLQEPRQGMALVAGGVLLVVAVSVMPLLWGDLLLDQRVLSVEIPLLGKIKYGSALPFDIGVTAIVVGLVMAVLDSLDTLEVQDT